MFTGAGGRLSIPSPSPTGATSAPPLPSDFAYWKPAGMIHAIYTLLLLSYVLIGVGCFYWLEQIDEKQRRAACDVLADRLWRSISDRCSAEVVAAGSATLPASEIQPQLLSVSRSTSSSMSSTVSSSLATSDCENATQESWRELAACYGHPADQVKPTSSYWRAIMYVISVYTTIGYGNVAAVSTRGRACMIVYAFLGIPLFLAFLGDMGQWFQYGFVIVYNFCVRRLRLRRKKFVGGDVSDYNCLRFAMAATVVVLYWLAISAVFMTIQDWSYRQALYFTFQSMALIGFGDIFPRETVAFIMVYFLLLMVGIILLSMCFFVLQAWIRNATRRVTIGTTVDAICKIGAVMAAPSTPGAGVSFCKQTIIQRVEPFPVVFPDEEFMLFTARSSIKSPSSKTLQSTDANRSPQTTGKTLPTAKNTSKRKQFKTSAL